MSWDVMMLKLRGEEWPSPDEIDEENTLPLGSTEEVRDRISEILPDVDWTDPAFGIYTARNISIEFSIGDEDLVAVMTLHIRGSGDPVPAVMLILEETGWAAIDNATEEYLDPSRPSDTGWEEFQEYRDDLMRDEDDEEE